MYRGMNRGIYSAARSMSINTLWMDTIAHNLSNVSTDGYKADGMTFADTMQREMYASGGKGQRLGSIGTGPTTATPYTHFGMGPIRQTDNPLDLAIKNPKGMFAVRSGAVGGPNNVRYTRDGSFQMDENRRLVTKVGDPVLDNQGREIIFPDNRRIDIAKDGTVAQGGEVVATLGVYEGAFLKEGMNLWVPAPNFPAPTLSADPAVQQGAMEGSNAEAITAMVDLIRVSRHFELNQKAIQTEDEQLGRLLETLRQA